MILTESVLLSILNLGQRSNQYQHGVKPHDNECPNNPKHQRCELCLSHSQTL